MAARLEDSELAARIRAGNQRRAARQQEKRRAAGRVQLNVVIDHSMKVQLEAEAARNNASLSVVVAVLLDLGLKQMEAKRDAERKLAQVVTV
jgi:hypothetical protein